MIIQRLDFGFRFENSGFGVSDLIEGKIFNTAFLHFKNISSEFKQAFESNNIFFQSRQGISDNLEPDIYYELDLLTFIRLNRVAQTYYLENANLILTDLSEGGYVFLVNKFYERKCKIKNLIIAVSSQNFTINLPNTKVIHLSTFFALLTLVNSEAVKSLPTSLPTHNPTKKLLFPVRKARLNRLLALSRFWEEGLLENADWSLVIDFDNNYAKNSWSKSRTVSENRFSGNLNYNESIQKFIEHHKHLIPKNLSDVPAQWEYASAIHRKWINRYETYVGAETYENINTNVMNNVDFITEKTFKGFLLNCPVLTLNNKDSNKWLEKLGFYMPGDYDHLEGLDRIEAVINYVKNPKFDSERIRKNYELITDKKFLIDTIVKKFKNI